VSKPCDGLFEWSLQLPPDLIGPITIEAYVPSDAGTKQFQALREVFVG
jgi:hypothetical protein